MRQIPIRRQIRIERLQNKNHMVGQAFNPSGITSEEIIARENAYVKEMMSKTLEERKIYWEKVKSIIESRKKKGIHASWEWEWCTFKRNKHILLEEGR